MLIAILAATAVLDIAAAPEKPELSHLLDTVGLAVERKLRGSGESDTQFKNRRAETIDLLVDHLLRSVLPPKTTRGRRLTQAGEDMKNFVNAILRDNDDGCQDVVTSHRFAVDRAWENAKGSMQKALQLFRSAQRNNQGAIDILHSLGSSDSIKKALHYFENHWGGILQHNHDIAQAGLNQILSFATPSINGLNEPPLPLPPTQPPLSSQKRSCLVVVAGLVTMLVAITAGSYRWNMLNKKNGPPEAKKMLALDAEITDTE